MFLNKARRTHFNKSIVNIELDEKEPIIFVDEHGLIQTHRLITGFRQFGIILTDEHEITFGIITIADIRNFIPFYNVFLTVIVHNRLFAFDRNKDCVIHMVINRSRFRSGFSFRLINNFRNNNRCCFFRFDLCYFSFNNRNNYCWCHDNFFSRSCFNINGSFSDLFGRDLFNISRSFDDLFSRGLFYFSKNFGDLFGKCFFNRLFFRFRCRINYNAALCHIKISFKFQIIFVFEL